MEPPANLKLIKGWWVYKPKVSAKDEYTPDNYQSKISYEAGINPHHINQVKDIRINSIKIKDYTDIENKKQETETTNPKTPEVSSSGYS